MSDHSIYEEPYFSMFTKKKKRSCMFFYDQNNNLFRSTEGDIIYNIFEYITPTALLLFKKSKEDIILQGKNGQEEVELIWPEHDET